MRHIPCGNLAWAWGTCVAAAALLVGGSSVWAQAGSERPLFFEHPPLNYHGPDPLAKTFLPASTALGGQPVSPLLPPVEPLPPAMGKPYADSSGSMQSFMSPAPHAGQTYGGEFYGDQSLLGVPQEYCGLTDHKEGFFQKVGFTTTWIDRNDKFDDFGITELDLFLTVAVPAPAREWPLLITPAFNVRNMYGPKHIEFPQRLYETYVDFLWLPRLSPRLTAIVGVAPGLYTDFEADEEDAFRLTGKGLVRYEWMPGQLEVLLGVLYPNREDVALLPAGGVIWTPTPDRRYELLFPRPKLARRILVGPHFEDWLYLGGEWGGNSYTIERVAGVAEDITLRDFRVYVGLERKLNGGAGYRLEAGYVTGRVIEFESGLPDVEADDTAMVRGGIVF